VLDEEQVTGLTGCTVFGSRGEVIGRVMRVYVDPRTGGASWLAVRTGRFARCESLVPVRSARLGAGRIDVPYGRDTVRDAPPVPDTPPVLRLDDVAEHELSRYYGLQGREAPRPPR
jgi:sporulation protein YlmC with PRC-barrel domain